MSAPPSVPDEHHEAAPDPAAPDPAAPDPAAPDPAERDLPGLDRAGPDRAELDHAGPDRAERDLPGPDRAEPDGTGPDLTGPGATDVGAEQPRLSRSGSLALAQLFGYRIISFGDGQCVAEWTPAPPFINAAGGVWGGAVSAVVDTVCAMAVAAALDQRPRHLPTVSMHVDFLRPLAVGGTYLLHGRALRVGGRLAVADTHVMDANELLLARATCTFSIRR
jgi:uncharacterized protein (TIGR00369 family)